MYKLSPEDTDYCRNFRSSIDGSNIRLGGQLGLVGIGNKVYELNNVIFKVNREYANRIIQSELGFDELLDKRLEIISEQLLIAQQQEILGQWKTFIKNSFLKERFPFLSDDVMNEMLGDLENELDSKEKHVIEKYKNSNLNGNIFSSDEKNGRRK